jgi:putative hydrolase of the HAD superfamily
MRTVLVLPRTHDPFREAWEQAAVTAPHVGHTTTDLTGFLAGLADRR